MFTTAITRKPGPDFTQGLTTSTLGTPNYKRIVEQHRVYVNTLRDLGLEVIDLDPLTDYPDGYFVEDTAVVIPEIAVITNPGAETRRGEQDTIEPVLAQFREMVRIQPPGTLEGGDVLIIEKHALIGISARTNPQGADQLAGILRQYGYRCTSIPVESGLHLKSSINYIGKNTMLVTEEWSSNPEICGYDLIVVENQDAYAANTLLVNECLITPKGFPRVRQRIEALGLEVIELEVSEAQKMDGGLTCMSLRF